MAHWLAQVRKNAEEGAPLSAESALAILRAAPPDLPEIFAAATALRRRFFGDRLRLCSILNARSGACAEDCAFCAQSAAHETHADVFPLLGEDAIARAGREAAASLPITHYGIVTSGGALDAEGVERIERVIRRQTLDGVSWCASLGSVRREGLARLKAAGLVRFHHNLETAERFFPAVCSTHTYRDRLETIRAAKEVGLEVCAGGILGMGESLVDRVEFACALACENVDSIPLNFLIPIPGTRLGRIEPPPPVEILKAIAMVRFVNPRAEIKVCAGRAHLRDLQSMIFAAGATGMMVGPLLTVAGRRVEEDLRMLDDLGFAYAR
jgi:biotin synthase